VLNCCKNRKHDNPCLNHPGAALRNTSKCDGSFIYVQPDDQTSKERWLAFMSTANAAARHNHPIPIESKMDSKLKLDIDKALEVDPSVTPHAISNGYGLGYSPITISNAAGNSKTLSNYIYKNKIKDGSSSAGGRHLIENFGKYIKNKVDAQDTKACVDEQRNTLVLELSSPYSR
jgi:hypothetical protein